MHEFTTIAGGAVLDFELHAVERFNERVRPGLEPDAAAAELRRLAEACGVVQLDRPEWVAGVSVLPTRWLVLGPDIALPIQGRAVLSCIVRGYISDAALADRSAHRRSRTAARQAKRGRGTRAASGNDAPGRGARKRREAA